MDTSQSSRHTIENIRTFSRKVCRPRALEGQTISYECIYHRRKYIYVCPGVYLSMLIFIFTMYGIRKLGLRNFNNTLCYRPLLSPEYFYHGLWWWMVDRFLFLLFFLHTFMVSSSLTAIFFPVQLYVKQKSYGFKVRVGEWVTSF